MARTGFERGFAQGVLQGAKTGFGMGSMRTGFACGNTDGTANMDKLQDPELLIGNKLPLVHWNAESCTTNVGGNVLTAVNLSNKVGAPSITVASDPNRVGNDVNNNRGAITFDTTDYFSGGALTGKTEATLMCVFKINTTATTDLLTYIFNSISFPNTSGDIILQTIGGNQIQSTLGGSNSSNFSRFSTPANLNQTQWYLLTGKYRLNPINGPGSEQEVYINGTKQNIILNTQTYDGNESTVFSTTSVFYGGNPSQTRGGNLIATALVFDYWINESEQIRIENYLRDYYGIKF